MGVQKQWFSLIRLRSKERDLINLVETIIEGKESFYVMKNLLIKAIVKAHNNCFPRSAKTFIENIIHK